MDGNHLNKTLEQEQLWIEQSKQHPSAFEPLYNKYYPAIYRFIYRRTEDDELAADLCSQTFFKALSGIKKFQWQGLPLAAWLYRIAGNEIKKHYRNRRTLFLIEEDKLLADNELHDEWEALKYSDQLRAILNGLSELEVRIIELKYFEGCKFTEMSAILQMKESAIKMRLYRLLHKIKQILVSNVEV